MMRTRFWPGALTAVSVWLTATVAQAHPHVWVTMVTELLYTPDGSANAVRQAWTRSFAADAHDCIVVRVLGPTGYKVVARLNRARKRAPL
jgi:Protein of unknown function (DUF1007)